MEGMEQSPKEYYENLKELISENKLPKVNMKMFTLPAYGVFSFGRMYLKVTYAGIVFLICCAPYGKGMFVSYWHYNSVSWFRRFFRSIPIIGVGLENLFWSETLFKLDLKHMFQSVLHSLILKTLDKEVEDKGLRALSEYERRYKVYDLK